MRTEVQDEVPVTVTVRDVALSGHAYVDSLARQRRACQVEGLAAYAGVDAAVEVFRTAAAGLADASYDASPRALLDREIAVHRALLVVKDARTRVHYQRFEIKSLRRRYSEALLSLGIESPCLPMPTPGPHETTVRSESARVRWFGIAEMDGYARATRVEASTVELERCQDLACDCTEQSARRFVADARPGLGAQGQRIRWTQVAVDFEALGCCA
ncbi:hypothetical protein OG216_47475 (plasmid) [Streptomycetaceae bacterium NBC_01309]